MKDVTGIEKGEDYFLMNTGSPHYVIFVEDIDDINIVENGQAIRYSKRFRAEGINVNFVEVSTDKILVATYERGVEDETLSCGTGVTAAAISTYLSKRSGDQKEISIETKGGKLLVRFEPAGLDSFTNVWLCGKAEQVFKGEIQINQEHPAIL
jgi:diaminopimelate epimerase